MALLFSLAAETHYSCVSFSMTLSPAPGSAAGRSDTGSVGAFFLLPVLQASDSCARVLEFPLLKACRIPGSISYAHITCWSPNSWAFLTPHLLQILLRRLYHLTELNRTGESVQARSFVEDNCHQNQCIKKLQHSPAHLSVASWMLLTFAVRF